MKELPNRETWRTSDRDLQRRGDQNGGETSNRAKTHAVQFPRWKRNLKIIKKRRKKRRTEKKERKLVRSR